MLTANPVLVLDPMQSDFALVQHNVRQIVRRYRDISQDSDAYYFLIIQLAGQAELEQDHSRAHLSQVGDMALINSLQPCTFSYNPHIGSRQLSLHFPHQVLQQHNPRINIDFYNPAIGEVLGKVPISTQEQVLHAVAIAGVV